MHSASLGSAKRLGLQCQSCPGPVPAAPPWSAGGDLDDYRST